MTESKTYPYQNFELHDMDGEQWEDLPGFDGEYLISNYGRIKSLRKWRSVGHGSGYYTNDRILKVSLLLSKNKYLNTNNYFLSLRIKGKIISVARYVYYVFVASFDLEDPKLIISYKDFDGRNVKPINIFLNRIGSPLARAFKNKRTEKVNKMAVLQLELNGKMVARFKSIHEASKKTGSISGGIARCAWGKVFQHNGFRWEFENTVEEEKPEKGIEKDLFHEGLWKKIGRPEMVKENPIPVLNLLSDNLPGEQWKFIEGTNNSYQVSNLGRVKAYSRFKGNKGWYKESILKLIGRGNELKPATGISIIITGNGKALEITVARLVYYHFVERFELRDRTKIISFKDGCFYNLKHDNLFMKEINRPVKD